MNIKKYQIHLITGSLSIYVYIYIYVFYKIIENFGDVSELGVLYWQLNPNDYENDEELRNIRETKGYDYMVHNQKIIIIIIFLIPYFGIFNLKN